MFEKLASEEQPGAAIEHEAGSFGKGDSQSIAVMLAAFEDQLISSDDSVGGHQVVTEHRDLAAPELGNRVDLKFDV